ncbi:MAG: type IV toxin-antitoxin system AbiEi family antitoxin domain-containing protein [Anaerolineae bacterium]|nr:type IV toxin-antitoxin system AbiEi family antitoxin domain-containing protein [Anaerolineae bacterium]
MADFQQAARIFDANDGMLRTAQALDLGIAPATLYTMRDRGIIVEVDRGIYRLSGYPELSSPDFVIVALRYPRAVISLISALSYHDLTTQIPHSVYIALPRGIKKPEPPYPPLEVVWLSAEPYEAGIETIEIDSAPVKIYGKEKSICDSFKFRNKYGEDVAIEALKNYMRLPASERDMPALLHYARINRVDKVIQPYLKALI